MGDLQKNSVCRLTTPFGEDTVLAQHLSGTEGISELFRWELEVSADPFDLDFPTILGQPVTIEIDLAGGGDRFVHGIVSRISQLESPGDGKEGGSAYSLEVVPWTWMLTRRQDSRIFQEMTIPDIVKQVFDDLGYSDYEFKLTGNYDPLVNCVQYQETDFAFISRLLEAEGIFYFFTHEESRHVMVLTDSVEQVETMPNLDQALFHGGAITEDAEERINMWHVERVLLPAKYAMTDYNFQDPATDLLVNTASNAALPDTDKLEIFEYPGDYVNLGGEGEAKLAKGDGRIRLRMEEGDTRGTVAEGRSNVRAFVPGHTFDLDGHARTEYNIEWLMTRTEHELSADGDLSGFEDVIIRYRNTFHCVPASVPYRPKLATARARILGPQTATVVGPAGEEIYVDKFGRVKLQFHWDRYGQKDETSSCWVRVSQHWAGKGWGTVYHPRIGQEVIVEFLEGNPDRPLITGRVYNGMNPIPYSTPTQSGILTRSSKGATAENFNQLRFEDNKGSEEVYLHAEKDMNRVVEADDSEDVGANQKSKVKSTKSVTVGSTHTEKIGGQMDLTVEKDRSMTIGKALAETVGEGMTVSVGKAMSETIGEARTLTIGKANTVSVGEAESHSVGKDLSVEVGKSQSVSVGKNLTFSVGSNSTEEVGKTYSLKAKKITIEAEDELKIKVGKAEMTFKKNGDVTVKGKKINIKGSGDIIMKGKKIAQN